MQRTRHMLVYMMDMLLDIFEGGHEDSKDYGSFHLDSQTIPLLDYLEIRPEKEKVVRKLIKGEKLLVGPWFCLPDEFSVGGESLIRNLLLGHKITKNMLDVDEEGEGSVSKTGYSPFGWGQISQMPQIYKGFRINFAAFYRGVNTEVAPKSEYIWEGADGTRIVGSRLAKRPRYNVWYIIQRPAYWRQKLKKIDDRTASWSCGYGPFKFVGDQYHEFDAQYSRPEYIYDKTTIRDSVKQAMEEQDGDWTTPHRFWSCGHDSSCPDIREVQMIKDCREAFSTLGYDAEIVHGTFKDFQDEVIKDVLKDRPIGKMKAEEGEMRHYSDSDVTSPLFGWIISARMDLKMDNFKTERELIQYAEPLAVYASMLGATYPKGFLDNAYNWLLQNHGHDSIGGCSREIVGQDMLFRTRQSREIADCVAERAVLDIAGTVDYSQHKDEQIALFVYNPAPFKRDEVATVNVEIPRDLKPDSFEIVDEKGDKADIQTLGEPNNSSFVVQSPNDTANTFLTKQHLAKVHLKSIPAMGYKTFFVRPINENDKVVPSSGTTASDVEANDVDNTMENEFLRVAINSNGTMTITDKHSNKKFKKMGYFRDTAEIGNPWQHVDIKGVLAKTTVGEIANTRVNLIRDGALEAAFKVSIKWELPKCRDEKEKARSGEMEIVRIESVITLRKGQKWVDIVTEVDNTVEDHYLQVAFPSGIRAETAFAQGQFDVLERPVKPKHSDKFREPPQTEQPMNSFIDITDGKNGLAILNEGMKAYEAHKATEHDEPELRLTLLRSFPLRICVTQEMTDYSQFDKSSQCLGKHKFHYAIMPHQGDWKKANLWNAAEQFNLPLVIGQTAPTKGGTEPIEKSFLEISKRRTPDESTSDKRIPEERIAVSAVKQSENGKGWVVRLFNPTSKTITARLQLNGGKANSSELSSPVERLQKNMALPGTSGKPWKMVEIVNLEEDEKNLEPEENLGTELKLDNEGLYKFKIKRKQILTLEFLAVERNAKTEKRVPPQKK